jgi:GNAT superfamily N-acetyltransferase
VLSPHSILDAESRSYPVASASGARLQSVRDAIAVEFLQRFGLTGRPTGAPVGAWGAFQDRSTLIGAGTLTRVSESVFGVQVAVAPDRRRLGIGGELLGILIQEAAGGGARVLTGSCPASAVEAQCLIASLQLLSARRVQHDRAVVVVFLPRTTATATATKGPR